MANSFELIDLKSGNVLADFESEAAALASLRSQIESHGANAISDLSLMLITDDDQYLVALGEDLELLVRQASRTRVA